MRPELPQVLDNKIVFKRRILINRISCMILQYKSPSTKDEIIIETDQITLLNSVFDYLDITILVVVRPAGVHPLTVVINSPEVPYRTFYNALPPLVRVTVLLASLTDELYQYFSKIVL